MSGLSNKKSEKDGHPFVIYTKTHLICLKINHSLFVDGKDWIQITKNYSFYLENKYVLFHTTLLVVFD